ncbi:amino acid adenylation domain-containing protein [Streptomyces sp. NPDC002054]|uniref:amino acid adenylation domain-containing protein n=1 Tax=Streptomyces sp. NPDC002054 TaxID=3154663 RepID=UPI00332E8B08
MRTFVDEIAAHAALAPDRVALTTPDGELTYEELAARIEALAGMLRARGARPETVCAVAVGRGADAVVATAAVVRSGAAFLVLDVEQPPARLAALVRSGGADLLLTTSALAGPLEELPVPGRPVLLDRPAPVAPGAVEPPDGRSLAYVSHTSGSTGEPSAVLVEHRGVDNYLRCVARDYGLGPDTVALQIAPPGYDASVRDTFAPLLAGGRLVLVPRSALLRPAEFGAAVRDHGVNTLLSVTPSYLSFLAGQPDAAGLLSGLRLVVSSGESLRPFLAAGGRALLSGAALVNQYGPTECTMTSTRYAVPADPDTTADLVGTPIDGVVVRLLDAALAPVPHGETGEVYLGGAGVARGYRGLAARTAERFVPDPLGPPGARLYRTGDLARTGPGGLEYLGRGDRQVKIRGYRVDPAEVEGALLAHPGVTGAVVTADTDDQGRVFLLAHVTGDLADTPDPALRAHLATTLPPHLMPRRFLRLDRLPTTRSGKADRRALAETGGRS